MRQVSIAFRILLGMIAAISLVSVACNEMAPKEETEQVIARVVLTTPMLVDQAVPLITQHGLRVTDFEHHFTIGDEVQTAFLPAYPGENVEQLHTRWDAAYMAFIRGMATSLDNGTPLGSESLKASSNQLAESFAEAAVVLPQLRHEVDAVFMVGQRTAVDALQLDPSFKSVDIRAEPERAEPKSRMNSIETSCYRPAAGRTITRPSPYYSGQREAYNYFGWNSICFINNATFELDFVLSFTAGTYLDSYTYWINSYYGFPRYEYAVTNQPSAYLDARTSDDQVAAYTLGCANAVQLRAGTTYYTYWRTRNGSASSDYAEVIAEVGHNVCNGGVSTWCSGWYPSRDLITPNWSILVPGTTNW
jgi:hypothetical protein